MKEHGFYMQFGKMDVFIVTLHKNKTRSLCKEICNELLLPVNEFVLSDIARQLRPATLEVKSLRNGRKYNDISGKNFGGCGHFLDEDLDLVIRL